MWERDGGDSRTSLGSLDDDWPGKPGNRKLGREGILVPRHIQADFCDENSHQTQAGN
jgi:hypothetical protein